jgi:ubiquitin C-terminal hydrolase
MGLTGIRNINNSCYLSSSLQCLSHVVALSNYFLQGQFKKELNLTNPLGTQGKLAIGYAKLIKSLWMDEKDSVAPFHIKDIVGKFKKQFNNQEQHDS